MFAGFASLNCAHEPPNLHSPRCFVLQLLSFAVRSATLAAVIEPRLLFSVRGCFSPSSVVAFAVCSPLCSERLGQKFRVRSACSPVVNRATSSLSLSLCFLLAALSRDSLANPVADLFLTVFARRLPRTCYKHEREKLIDLLKNIYFH